MKNKNELKNNKKNIINMSTPNRLASRAILAGDLPTLKKHIGSANPLDRTDYGPKGQVQWGAINYQNRNGNNMLALAMRPRQVFGDTPISDSQNPESPVRDYRNRSRFALDASRLVLQRAKQLGVLEQLRRELIHIDAAGSRATPYQPNVFDLLIMDYVSMAYGDYLRDPAMYPPFHQYSLYEYHDLYEIPANVRNYRLESLPINRGSYTYQLLALLAEYYPDQQPSMLLPPNVRAAINEIRDPVSSQLAIDAPYRSMNVDQPNYMARMPNDIRNHVLSFLRLRDGHLRRFPVVPRDLIAPAPLPLLALPAPIEDVYVPSASIRPSPRPSSIRPSSLAVPLPSSLASPRPFRLLAVGDEPIRIDLNDIADGPMANQLVRVLRDEDEDVEVRARQVKPKEKKKAKAQVKAQAPLPEEVLSMVLDNELRAMVPKKEQGSVTQFLREATNDQKLAAIRFIRKSNKNKKKGNGKKSESKAKRK